MLSSRDSSAPGPASTTMPAARSAPGARARDERIRVLDRDHDPCDAGLDERIAARRRAAVVRAGLERDPDGRAADVCGRDSRRRAAPSLRHADRPPAGCGRVRSRRRRRATITQPTRGFGSQTPIAISAQCRASRIGDDDRSARSNRVGSGSRAAGRGGRVAYCNARRAAPLTAGAAPSTDPDRSRRRRRSPARCRRPGRPASR